MSHAVWRQIKHVLYNFYLYTYHVILCIHHWAAAVSRVWAKASACRLQVSMSCAVLCQIVSLQYLSRSSFHRLAGLPKALSYGLQVVTREVHRSSSRRLICPAQDHFIFLALLIIKLSMTFVLSLTQMLVFLSFACDVEHTSFTLFCAAACLFCACLVSGQYSAPYVIAGSTQELYTRLSLYLEIAWACSKSL